MKERKPVMGTLAFEEFSKFEPVTRLVRVVLERNNNGRSVQMVHYVTTMDEADELCRKKRRVDNSYRLVSARQFNLAQETQS